jgi:GTP-binding protein YchF
MRLGIIGLPQAGKRTVFEALTAGGGGGHGAEERIGTVKVPDARVERLSEMYHPRKTIFAQVEYFLPAMADGGRDKAGEAPVWARVRDCDALIHIVRNFSVYGLEPAVPERDFTHLDQELILSDLVVAEKRLERLELDKKRGKGVFAEEADLLARCRQLLDAETPLRREPDLAAHRLLRGFAFLSAKPTLVLFNNADEDDALPPLEGALAQEACLVVRGKLEQELAQMTPAEVQEFLTEFNIGASAMDRVIQHSYELMGLISFFTVGEDEVRAWTIQRQTPAVDAAEVIHSDIKRGFIRAEVLAYPDLMAAGSYAAARKNGTVRLEGKNYAVQDGDIINFRFNV